MALFKIYRGESQNLSSVAKVDGHAYFCTDDGSFWIDYLTESGEIERKQINANQAKELIGIDITQEKVELWDSFTLLNMKNGEGEGSLQQKVYENDMLNPKATGLGAVAFGGYRGDETFEIDLLQGTWRLKEKITDLEEDFYSIFNYEFLDGIEYKGTGFSIAKTGIGWGELSGEWYLNENISFPETEEILRANFNSWATLYTGIQVQDSEEYGKVLCFVDGSISDPVIALDGTVIDPYRAGSIMDINEESEEFKNWFLQNATRGVSYDKGIVAQMEYIDDYGSQTTFDVYSWALSADGTEYFSGWLFGRDILIHSKLSEVANGNKLLRFLETAAEKIAEYPIDVAPTEAKGIQSVAIGAHNLANDAWNFVGGKESKTYQRNSLAFGGACEAGMNQEEFNGYWSVNIEKEIPLQNQSLYGQTLYFRTDKAISFMIGDINCWKSENSNIINDYYEWGRWELNLKYGNEITVNSIKYQEVTFEQYSYTWFTEAGMNEKTTIDVSQIVFSSLDGVVSSFENCGKIPQYIASGIQFQSYDSENDIITYADGTTYTLEEAQNLEYKDSSGRTLDTSYSMSVAFGEDVKTKARSAFTFGANNKNYARYSFLGGRNSTLAKDANTSFLFGFDCHSTAYDTINIGDKNNVGAQYGIALGILNEIPVQENGKYYQGSTLIGYGHRATLSYQTLLGRWSVADNNLFAVGFGTGEDNRRNIFAVTTSGQAYVPGAPANETHAVRLKELNDVQTSLTTKIDTAITNNNTKWSALKIKTSGNQGLIGGDYSNSTTAYVKSYGGIGLGIRPKIEEAATGAIALGIDPTVTGYAGVAIGFGVQAGRYDFVGGVNSKSTQENGAWYNVLLGGNNNTSYASTTLIGQGHTATRNYQTLLGSWADTTKNPIFAVGIGGLKGGVPTNAFEVLEDGRMKLYTAPTEADDVVRKVELDTKANVSDLDTKVNVDAEQSGGWVQSVYTRASNGNIHRTWVHHAYGETAPGRQQFVQTSPTGQLACADPTNPYHAVNKQYFEANMPDSSQITENTNKITALENLIYDGTIQKHSGTMTDFRQKTGGADLEGFTLTDGSSATIDKISGKSVFINDNDALFDFGEYSISGERFDYDINEIWEGEFTVSVDSVSEEVMVEIMDENANNIYFYLNNDNRSHTFTANGTMVLMFSIFPELYTGNKITINGLSVVRGAEAKPWQPYLNNVKHAQISGIKSIGRNLLNYENSLNELLKDEIEAAGKKGLGITSGTIKLVNNDYTVFYLPVLPNTDYTVKNHSISDVYWNFSDGLEINSKTSGEYPARNGGYSTHNSGDWKYLLLQFNKTSLEHKLVTVNFGTNPIDYEPYSESIAELPEAIELCEWDYIQGGLVSKCTSQPIYIDGSENWEHAQGTGYNYFYLNLTSYGITRIATGNKASDYFKHSSNLHFYTSGNRNNLQIEIANIPSGVLQGSTIEENINEFKAYISQNPFLLIIKNSAATLEPITFNNEYIIDNMGQEEVIAPKDEYGLTSFDYGAGTTQEITYYTILGGNN